ncbi:tRNA pseudouridine(38-40) synthase TruA [Tunicatimonas pelagia]|nr:tRNA pseudouridine(38-40) synthase TruA [Tunicatimonas pelagia]WKN46361.1 tRNA pseudouridine(38-40) synthase TruA [Tunicatimonas pelagia]
MRYFLTIKYRGAAYHGWQIQQNALSVQEVLNQALSQILREPITTVGSGRTDAGVHAQGQVAHFNSNRLLAEEEYLRKFNAVLPHDISITELVAVTDDTHARFSATRRSYQYFIHQKKNPFLNGLSYLFPTKIDVDLMNKAAQQLVERKKQNYACFSKSKTQNTSYDCHIFRANWHVLEEDRLVFSISANRFLRGMVRAIVGTMLDIGTQTTSLTNFADIIASHDRRRAGRSVDACGLFLTEVTYPAEIYQQND